VVVWALEDIHYVALLQRHLTRRGGCKVPGRASAPEPGRWRGSVRFGSGRRGSGRRGSGDRRRNLGDDLHIRGGHKALLATTPNLDPVIVGPLDNLDDITLGEAQLPLARRLKGPGRLCLLDAHLELARPR
jgi:hypothetical protein